MPKAIFLDRDGTLNEEVNYLSKIEDIKIFPSVKKALQKFKSLGFLNIVVTNQSGIARGFFTEEILGNIHKEFKKLLTINDDNLVDDIFYSPFHIDGVIKKLSIESEDRKPGVGMIMKAKEKYSIDLNESFLIGDSFTDMKCAKNAGLIKILVKTGYGMNDIEKCIKENIEIDFVANDLLEASEFVEKQVLDLTKESS